MTTRQNYAPRAARPRCAQRLQCAAQQFSKFPSPASRFASPTALSAARLSYPRFTSAEITSASIPAGKSRRFCASTATASSLSSTRPPCAPPSSAHADSRQPRQVAPANRRHESSTLIPLKIFSASEDPRRKPKAASQKMFFSRGHKSVQSQRIFRTCVWIRRVTSVRSSRARRKSKAHLNDIADSATSTSTGLVFFRQAVREAGQSSLASIAAFLSPVNAKSSVSGRICQ